MRFGARAGDADVSRFRARRPPRPAPDDRRSVEELATVRIESIAAGGDGIARIDGMACFVPRAAPGDVVHIAFQRKGRHARGRVLRVIEPSPPRVAPRCSHYDGDRCGGCQLQHVEDDAQQIARSEIVRDALTRIGRRDVAPPPVTRGATWEYRSRITLTLQRRGAAWIGGFHPYDDPTRVFALRECPIAEPVLVEVWHSLQPMLRQLATLTELRRLRLSMRRGNAGVHIVVSGCPATDATNEWSDDVRRRVPAVQEVVFQTRDDFARPEIANGHVDDLVPDAAEAVAFTQVNVAMSDRLRDFVADQVLRRQPSHVVDAYAGVGRLASRLASAGVRVTAIEADRAAAMGADAALVGRPNARVWTARVEDVLHEALPADVVVLNPPRRGVDAAVTERLQRAIDSRVLVYVSCDAATLARDLAALPAWTLERVQCFDMFPQTAHVETVCVLTREGP